MKFAQVIQAVGGQVLHEGKHFADREIAHVVTCDLMSDLLVTDEEEVLLLTSLPSDQAARTADMVGACGIVLVNGKKPQPGLLDLAKEMDITLITSEATSFEASYQIGRLLHGS